MSVGEAGQHIVTFQTRVRAQELVHAVAGRQHSENMLDRQAVTAKGRFPTEDFRVYGFTVIRSSSRASVMWTPTVGS